jgi:superfamily I DNA/RNA helicase/CRISPR/Cas system-associated exonuclease Cas4 (RecB family)
MDALKGLSDAQRAAATHADGPLIVLAGPGTGKTRVIIHRVAHLIAEGAAPESIVALTFTTRAAEELRSRLSDLMGDARADAVNAMTFHGLGLRIVRRFADLLGLPSEQALMDRAQERRLMREIVRAHDLYPHHRAEGRDAVLDSARDTIGVLSQNAITPEGARALARRWRERLDAGHTDDELLPKSWKEKLNGDLYRKEQRFLLEAFESSVRLYELVRDESARRGLLTFDDLILRPIELLRTSEAARAILRSDFRHFVVDEFQDVNPAQIEMLRLLAPPREREGDGPDLCVVGDDDQAIYEFRGADERAFQKFARTWKGHATHRLEENRRSAPPIIAAGNAIIERGSARFSPEKRVRPGKADPARDTTASVECVAIDDDAQTGDTIAAMILADRHGTGEGTRAWRDYAIIASSNLDLDRAGDALRLEGIPFWRGRRASVLEDQGVQDALRWARVLARDDRHALLALLSRSPACIPFDLLRRWLDAFEHQHARDERTDGDGAWALLAWLTRHVARDDAPAGAIRRFADIARSLKERIPGMPAELALAKIVRGAGVAEGGLPAASERAARISNLASLMRFVREKRKGMEEPGGIAELLAYLDDLGEDDRAIGGDDRVNGEQGDEEPPDAVTLVTAHSSKGLEFDTVFLVKVRSRGFPAQMQGDATLPDWMTRDAEDTRTREERHADEQRRLFYVAMTRAERRLVLLAKRRKGKKQGKSADYFDELTSGTRGAALVTQREGADVLAEAARAGVKLASHVGLGESAPSGDWATASERRRALLDASRREARWLAAAALDESDRAGVDEPARRAVRDRLEESSQRLSIIAEIESAGRVPAWIEGASESVRAFAKRLQESWERAAPAPSRLFAPLVAPLGLSYSWIDEYRRCPRCFYFRRVLNWPEAPGPDQIVGTLVHGVLEDFYRARQMAESEGGVAPGLDWMLRHARDEFFKRSAGKPDREHLEQALEQLRTTHERLFDPAEEVEQIEFVIDFPYSRNGVAHRFRAKIDRLDRMPGGKPGHRIIDYKTGRAWPKLLNPEPDDLQLGVYALALAHHQGAPEGEPAQGSAEYWVLARGERGRIDLPAMDMEKVRATIDRAIDGMLEGRFESSSEGFGKCSGLCRVGEG